MWTPWGESDSSEKIATGIVRYNTPSHGGYHLSARRQALMPKALRKDEPWYEEDVDWALVVLAFPQFFKESDVKMAESTTKNYHPDMWEKWKGVVLPLEESVEKAERHFRLVHRNDFVVDGVWGDWLPGVPKDHVRVSARRTADEQKRYFNIPKAEYGASRQIGSFVVDTTRYQEVDEQGNPVARPRASDPALRVSKRRKSAAVRKKRRQHFTAKRSSQTISHVRL